ncbi:MAG: sulfate reduction electron transfer complex DsrMKJOP subunit DsrJ [Candidatus Hydrothermarchaeota archaeon]|nr:sulfate reduction electron transfer complex DsrMKJOP subunit DsrJ [Candidatus Hydrothermarchaeota archaeon]
MYDAKWIVSGLIVFLCLVTLPLWYTAAAGGLGYKVEPKIITEEKKCIEPTEFMRDEHMVLLNKWRDTVVRGGERIYVASDGEIYDMSLTKGCMRCHSNKEEFCDECHNYVGVVNPYCWDCHTYPGGELKNENK